MSAIAGDPAITICIPTRNRPHYCLRAIRSVLEQAGHEDFRLFVSDNSTDPDARRSLAEAVPRLGRAQLLQPPPDLQMSAHWHWMISQALGESASGLLLILTDRHILRQGALAFLARAHRLAPADALVYKTDVLNDLHWPIRLCTTPSTGQVRRRDALEAIDAFERFEEDHIYWPRLLNCAVPIQVMREAHARKHVSASPAPVSPMGYRTVQEDVT